MLVGSLVHLAVAQTVRPDDPLFNQQWNLATIGAPAAWETTTGSTNIVIALIDTWVDYTHPDRAANMWVNPGEIGLDALGRDKATNGMDDDGNGYVDDVHGADVHDQDGDPMEEPYFDGTGLLIHGTACAGIIGTVGHNGIGTAGVNWSVSIMAIRAFPSDEAGYTEARYVAAMIAAFDYVLGMKRRGVNIVSTSNSYFNSSYSQTLKERMEAAGAEGILNVFAAGNNGLSNDTIGLYSCSYSSPSILSVAKTDNADLLSPFSAFGATTVHLAAPGRCVTTTSVSVFCGTTIRPLPPQHQLVRRI